MLKLNDLFSKDPFVYVTEEGFFIIGRNGCVRCSGNVVEVYRGYMDAVEAGDDEDARHQCRNVRMACEFVLQNLQNCENRLDVRHVKAHVEALPQETKDDLLKQLDQYIKYSRRPPT